MLVNFSTFPSITSELPHAEKLFLVTGESELPHTELPRTEKPFLVTGESELPHTVATVWQLTLLQQPTLLQPRRRSVVGDGNWMTVICVSKPCFF